MVTRVPLIQAEEDAKLRSERLNLSIAEMGLSVRTTNCLEETGILTVRDLLHATPRRLLSISNFGEKTLDEVYTALEKLGFYRPSRQGNQRQANQSQATTV
jgi:DNA-directed RNA polymerase subunit alpha